VVDTRYLPLVRILIGLDQSISPLDLIATSREGIGTELPTKYFPTVVMVMLSSSRGSGKKVPGKHVTRAI
jgi:hypothetical protein